MRTVTACLILVLACAGCSDSTGPGTYVTLDISGVWERSGGFYQGWNLYKIDQTWTEDLNPTRIGSGAIASDGTFHVGLSIMCGRTLKLTVRYYADGVSTSAHTYPRCVPEPQSFTSFIVDRG